MKVLKMIKNLLENGIYKLKLWLYMHFHQYDDYSVRATKWNDIRENVYAISTTWFTHAIVYYIYLHFKYPKCTIAFTHFKYEK